MTGIEGGQMKRLIAPASLLVGLSVAATPSVAVPTGPLAVTTSSLVISTSLPCATVPLTWYLTSAPADVTDWSVTGDIVDGSGASRGSIFEYESLPVTQAGDTFELCGLAEGTNSFTVAADVDGWASSRIYETRFVGTLTVTRTTPPPPPPPSQDATSVTWGGRNWDKGPKKATLHATVKIASSCATKRRVALTGLRRSGGWTTIESARLLAKRVTIDTPVAYKYLKVRVEVAETLLCAGATSRPIKVPKKPAR